MNDRNVFTSSSCSPSLFCKYAFKSANRLREASLDSDKDPTTPIVSELSDLLSISRDLQKPKVIEAEPLSDQELARVQEPRVRDILAGDYDGKRVRIRGWLQNTRSSGGIVFLHLRDGSGVVQSTVRKGSVPDKVFEEFRSAGIESAVELEGVVKNDPRAPGGKEVQVESGHVPYPAREEFPIARQFHGPEFLLDNRHLYIRSDKMRAILQVRSKFLSAARRWFDTHGYTEVQVQILITAAVDGGSILFEVKYFMAKAYLTQSWQLYAEAMIASVGHIYTVAPSFRAEKSRTRRHLTEYWHVEAEAPWCDLDCIMKVEEELLTHIVARLLETSREELKLFGRDPKDWQKVRPPFDRLTYDDAFKLIDAEKIGVKWGDDLGYEQ